MIRCFRIKGRVQGVGYRFWAVRKAKEIGDISGYVYNDESGDVLIYASGPEDSLNKMQTYCYEGPFFSRVDSIEPANDFSAFFPPIIDGVFRRL